MVEKILRIATRIRDERYPESTVVFAAGSIVRGEGTAYSDLDLVVVFDSLKHGYRESFLYDGVPVEAFIHDPFTINYFFTERDGPSGMPALMQMVKEGVEIPGPCHLSDSLKRLAISILDAGPPALTEKELLQKRYGISDLLDDLRDPPSEAVIYAVGSLLHGELANYYLRANGHWSGGGKSSLRALKNADPNVHARFCESFATLFKQADPSKVIALGEELLEPTGGLYFDGFYQAAPAEWTKPFP